MVIILVLGIPCGILLAAGVVITFRFLSRTFDLAGARAEHWILAPFRRFIWFEGLPLTKLPCAACGGLGVQSLINGAWAVIPPQMRDRQTDGSHPRLANTRRCPRCHGLGHRWVRVT